VVDLADLGSIRGFAARFLDHHDTFDLLVNNAGVMGPPVRRTTADGFEL
jgi:NAD(P)-dependent dehydrogenase (short-subunit alcohol dehydrogenase family)